MKKIEVKKIGPLSLFKSLMYMVSIVIAFMMVIGLVTLIIGAVTGSIEVIIIGLISLIGYPLMFAVIYGVFGTLMALIYNWLAGKFGGLELTIDEGDDEVKPLVNDQAQQ
jgi:hypothetical protein